MDEGFSALIATLKAGWTPGGAGVWVLVLMSAGMWWKGLPALLDAWTRRTDAEALRNDREFARLSSQIRAGEERHTECEQRCSLLQQQVAKMDNDRREESARLNKIIDGLIRQFRQLQISAVRVGMGEPPSVAATLMAELDRIPGGKLGDSQ